jgi:hypothetical protein
MGDMQNTGNADAQEHAVLRFQQPEEVNQQLWMVATQLARGKKVAGT